jgi:hypothetical protein
VYGPVRTVVWQGSAGDRRPYADQVGLWEAHPADIPTAVFVAFTRRMQESPGPMVRLLCAEFSGSKRGAE